MTPTKKNALVLIGNRNSGKDTMANLLALRYKHTGVIKFGLLSKQFVAEMLNVDVSYLEDKDFRTRYDIMRIGFDVQNEPLSPIHLLDVLFHGSEGNTEAAIAYRSAFMAYAKRQASQYELPVFTDIRRELELQYVLDNFNPLILHLTRMADSPPAETDKHIQGLAEKHANSTVHNFTGYPERVATRIAELVENYFGYLQHE